jgi:hypothetical protein
MKPILKAFQITCIVLALATCLQAQNKPAAAKTTGAVPIIDRDIFLGNPEIAGGQISPNGKFISFLKPYNGVLNIYVKKTDEPFEKAKQLTANERPVGGYFWSHDSKYILYQKDKGGDENYNIYAVNPADEAVKATGIPAAQKPHPMINQGPDLCREQKESRRPHDRFE